VSAAEPLPLARQLNVHHSFYFVAADVAPGAVEAVTQVETIDL